jgi:hypothetical protein
MRWVRGQSARPMLLLLRDSQKGGRGNLPPLVPPHPTPPPSLPPPSPPPPSPPPPSPPPPLPPPASPPPPSPPLPAPPRPSPPPPPPPPSPPPSPPPPLLHPRCSLPSSSPPPSQPPSQPPWPPPSLLPLALAALDADADACRDADPRTVVGLRPCAPPAQTGYWKPLELYYWVYCPD